MRRVAKFSLLLTLLFAVPDLLAQDPGGGDSLYVICGENFRTVAINRVEATFQVWFISNNTPGSWITAFGVPFLFSGQKITSVDTTVAKAYAGSIAEDFNILAVIKYGNPDPTIPPFHVGYGAVTFYQGVTGESLLFNVTVRVNGNDTICIDSLSTPTLPFAQSFVTQSNAYGPVWLGPYCCWVYMPGDVNLDDKVNIVDVVALVGHVFRGRALANSQAADVNRDCQVTMADIFRLFYFLFRAGEEPLQGCAS